MRFLSVRIAEMRSGTQIALPDGNRIGVQPCASMYSADGAAKRLMMAKLEPQNFPEK